MVKKDMKIHNFLFFLFYSDTFKEFRDGIFIAQAFGDVRAFSPEQI
jgi:hypothetical protein